MKVLLSLNAVFLLFIFFTPIEFSEEECLDSKAELFTTATKICNFTFNASGNGSCSIDAVDLEIGDDCRGTAAALVCTTNLESNPVKGLQYSLPSGVPDIYYEYSSSLGQTDRIGPINTFTFKGNYHENANGVKYPLFEYDDFMHFDLSARCEENDYAEIEITVELQKLNGSIYPIHDFAGADEVFYCDVFLETCDACSPPPITCNGGSDPIYEFTACGECGGCGSGGERGVNSEESTTSIRPNPFNDLVTVQYTLIDDSEVSLELIDAKGIVIRSIQTHQDEGNQYLELNTNAIQKGIYFCRLKVNDGVITRKIIKLK